jgi:hypothetical protein
MSIQTLNREAQLWQTPEIKSVPPTTETRLAKEKNWLAGTPTREQKIFSYIFR